MEKKLFYLELSAEPIRFDAVSQLTNVFFDDSNRQVSNTTCKLKCFPNNVTWKTIATETDFTWRVSRDYDTVFDTFPHCRYLLCDQAEQRDVVLKVQVIRM